MIVVKLVPIQGLLERYACLETLVLGVSQVNLLLLWLIASESGDRNKMSFIGKVSKISSTCVDTIIRTHSPPPLFGEGDS